MRHDEAPTLRGVAAEALDLYGTEDNLQQAEALIDLGNPEETDLFVAIAALNVIDKRSEKMRPHRDELEELPKRPTDGPRRATHREDSHGSVTDEGK